MPNFAGVTLRSTAAGLTLAEIIIAMALLATLLVTTGGLIARLLAASNKSGDLTAGTEICQRVLDQVVLRGTYDTSTAVIAHRIYTHNDQQASEFTYQVTSSPVAMPAPSPSGYYVVVDTWWWGQAAGGPNRAGMGKLHARLGRLVCP